MVSLDENRDVAKWAWRRWTALEDDGNPFVQFTPGGMTTGDLERFETPATWEEAVPMLTAYIKLTA